MSSLTQVAISTRKVIRYGIFFIIFLIVGKMLLGSAIGLYNKINPPPPPPPTVKFGKLPTLPFPAPLEGEVKPNLTFSLETAEGGLPALSPQTNVYFMPKISSNLLSLQIATDKAVSLGFSPNWQQVSDTLYKFPHVSERSELLMNIISGAFSISFDLKSDSSPLTRRPPAPEIAAAQVRSYLSSANLLPEDLTAEITHEFLKQEGESLVPALSLSESSLIKINFFRKSYNELPSLTPKPNESNVWFMVSGLPERQKQVIAAEFHYFPVDESESSTYPLKTAQEAWNELTSGTAYISSYGLNQEADQVKIRRIYLGYYDGGEPTEFFQPIIVLEGDKGFIAYVPAVTLDYYGE
ncbi:hypothetical protein HY502_03490 [Candidatus Woesebacteria bacterium]|nr:hypothetical protein [Candidatus Woesebacteria bacterium]